MHAHAKSYAQRYAAVCGVCALQAMNYFQCQELTKEIFLYFSYMYVPLLATFAAHHPFKSQKSGTVGISIDF